MKTIIFISALLMTPICLAISDSDDLALKETADNLNKRVPMPVNKYAELHSVYYINGTFSYSYRMLEHNGDKYDADEFMAMQKLRTTKMACTDPLVKKEIVDRVDRVKYKYYGKDLGYIGEFIVTKEDC